MSLVWQGQKKPSKMPQKGESDGKCKEFWRIKGPRVMLNFRQGLVLRKSDILMIKLGSLAVTKEAGGLHPEKIKSICKDLLRLKNSGYRPILVSSGAINAGRPHWGEIDPSSVSQSQAASSVGQHLLMGEFYKNLGVCAQILLTHEDLKNKKRSLNIRKTIFELLEKNILPIVNENDAVSFSEITVGDNDQLSAMLAQTIDAKVLLMISKTPGLFDRDPNDLEAKHLPFVKYHHDFSELNLKGKSSRGRGGMETKLLAVRKCTPLGIPVIISGSQTSHPILNPLTHEVGTIFEAAPKVKAKDGWILSRTKNNAKINIDKGAAMALSKNASLLPIGIRSIAGNFTRGDCVQILYKRKVIAFGIVEYSSNECDKIIGLGTSEIKNRFPFFNSKVVIHKNNLILK